MSENQENTPPHACLTGAFWVGCRFIERTYNISWEVTSILSEKPWFEVDGTLGVSIVARVVPTPEPHPMWQPTLTSEAEPQPTLEAHPAQTAEQPEREPESKPETETEPAPAAVAVADPNLSTTEPVGSLIEDTVLKITIGILPPGVGDEEHNDDISPGTRPSTDPEVLRRVWKELRLQQLTTAKLHLAHIPVPLYRSLEAVDLQQLTFDPTGAPGHSWRFQFEPEVRGWATFIWMQERPDHALPRLDDLRPHSRRMLETEFLGALHEWWAAGYVHRHPDPEHLLWHHPENKFCFVGLRYAGPFAPGELKDPMHYTPEERDEAGYCALVVLLGRLLRSWE
ncbi:uncharacterized protein BO97DRAFT_442535 [Aspergillus homomorphus CBS 101889]|uniref:Uncharacterized protein n=1 Tax=Aspergillus homomorphus (strain CBS 101889) TaxID=1450537 RepID=A0A395I1C7_ASPHC|nr:hypothetical protein BO97DRAFT_442535 [Aspergillus homomorphus CBS 101889]RAL13535.1 hypothetical protein BO97DRAFT_442535 [Aspergillus homomorphus CBS 101889]